MTESDSDWLLRRVREISEFDYSALQNDLTVKPTLEEYLDSATGPRVEVKVWYKDHGTTTELVIQGYMTDLELKRDFIDATAFGEINSTYLVTQEDFTVRGKRSKWATKRDLDR